MVHDAPIAMRERLFLFSILATTGLSAYLLLNHHPPFTPHLLPMTPLDEATPFWVWTVWPYALLWLSNFILPFCIRGRENFLQMAVTFLVALGILVVFWALWPTTFPRPPAPAGGSFTEEFYLLFVSVDRPLNCFPSGHITMPAMLLYFICRERPRKAVWIWTMFAFFSLSIFTTKQHYVWDLFGGLLTTFIALRASQWWRESRRLSETLGDP